MRSGIRGPNRTARALATRFKALQTVPVQIADWPPVYVDLRDWDGQRWFQYSPWSGSPREPDEQAVMQRFVKPGQVVYDIGANIGLHTALLSSIVGPSGRVCAFEPNPRLIPALTLTVVGMTNAKLFTLALSNSDGDADLFIPEGGNNMNASLAFWTGERRGRVTKTRCVRATVDRLVERQHLPVPNFIKCDVEGAEPQVFQGATQVLNRAAAPIVLFEANAEAAKGFETPIWAARDVLAALPNPNYQFFTIGAGGHLMRTKELDPVNSNVLAVPRATLENHPDLA
jgi:FkbM family methyltransferase